MTNEFDIADLLDSLSVPVTRTLGAREFHVALSEICTLFDIRTEVDEAGGMSYGPDGLVPGDQPLYFALRALAARRFGATS